MAKRSASSELNHDNWNEEEPPEKAGTFSKAAPDVLQYRVIKAAKRRSLGTPESARVAASSPFANFGGFAASPKTVTSASSKSENSTNGSVTKSCKASVTVEKTAETSTSALSGADNKSQDYCSKIKGLNESVSKWIKSHVDSNPFCILTPVFKDYEKYLNDIEAEEAKRQISDGKKNEISKDSDSSNWKISTPKSHSTFRVTSLNKENAGVSPGNSAEKQQDKSPAEKSSDKALPTNPFTSAKPLTFSFGTGASSAESKSAGFSFGSDKPFTFANVSKPVTESKEESKASDEDTEEPPKAEFSPVIEEGAKYSKRCKVFVKKGSALQDRGIGTLYLKPVESSNKTQLIVRAENSLGNLLINTLVTSSMSAQRKGTNVVMIVCIPTPETEPPPVPVMLKVKTSADADELLDKLKEHTV